MYAVNPKSEARNLKATSKPGIQISKPAAAGFLKFECSKIAALGSEAIGR
jgi:hypothetical protein